MRIVLLATAALLATAGGASAAVITSGVTSMGLRPGGGLGFGGVALARVGVGDAITPGCLCEGWGVAGNGAARSTYGAGFTNFASAALSAVTPSSAVSTVVSGVGLDVVHTYSAIAGTDLFRIVIGITNTTGAAINDVRYSRTLDWDVGPGHFVDDFTTVFGGPAGIGGNLIHTSFNPFAQPNPLVFRSSFCGVAPNTNAVDRPGDCGGYFVFGFGALNPGATRTFTTVIGSAATTSLLRSQFGALNVEAFHYTFDDDDRLGVTFGFGFVGVGLPPIDPPIGTPAPAAVVLFGLGAAALGLARRRRG